MKMDCQLSRAMSQQTGSPGQHPLCCSVLEKMNSRLITGKVLYLTPTSDTKYKKRLSYASHLHYHCPSWASEQKDTSLSWNVKLWHRSVCLFKCHITKTRQKDASTTKQSVTLSRHKMYIKWLHGTKRLERDHKKNTTMKCKATAERKNNHKVKRNDQWRCTRWFVSLSFWVLQSRMSGGAFYLSVPKGHGSKVFWGRRPSVTLYCMLAFTCDPVPSAFWKALDRSVHFHNTIILPFSWLSFHLFSSPPFHPRLHWARGLSAPVPPLPPYLA